MKRIIGNFININFTSSFYQLVKIDGKNYIADFYSYRWLFYLCPVLRYICPVKIYPVTYNFLEESINQDIKEKKSVKSISSGLGLLIFNSSIGIIIGEIYNYKIILLNNQNIILKLLLIIIGILVVWSLDRYIYYQKPSIVKNNDLKIKKMIKSIPSKYYVLIFDISIFKNISNIFYLILLQFIIIGGFGMSLTEEGFSLFIYITGILFSFCSLILVSSNTFKDNNNYIYIKKENH